MQSGLELVNQCERDLQFRMRRLGFRAGIARIAIRDGPVCPSGQGLDQRVHRRKLPDNEIAEVFEIVRSAEIGPARTRKPFSSFSAACWQ